MPPGLEGSRFPRWQLYRFAAGGSRKLPSVFASIQRLARIVPIKSANISNHGGSWVAFGSRLLPSHRAAVLRSGSPPDAGPATPRCSLGRTKRSAGTFTAGRNPAIEGSRCGDAENRGGSDRG